MKRITMKKILFGILLSALFTSCTGNKSFYFEENKTVDWTDKEKAQHQNLIELANYVQGKDKSEISNEVLFEKYIEFDYILKDTSASRIEERLESFDTLFYYFRKSIDSVGLKNLDAKPVRFFKDHEIYEPFINELPQIEPNVFAYYLKSAPKNPLGVLWFDSESNKLISWILIHQGSDRYFLAFNLL